MLLKAMEMPSTAFPSSHKRSRLAQPDTFFSIDVSVLAVPSHHLVFHVPGHDFWDHLLHNPPETEVRLVVPSVVLFALLF